MQILDDYIYIKKSTYLLNFNIYNEIAKLNTIINILKFMQKNQKCLTTLGAEKQREEQSNLFVKKTTRVITT